MKGGDIMSAVESIEMADATVEELRELVRVVLVDDVVKHTNADALELAIVGGWQCCVQLGEFRKGDMAIYCEIDAMLPIANPIFSFLEQRTKDLKLVGEQTYSRIKTIRLRKELSQGLLVPVPKGMAVKVGDNLTAVLGVVKYDGVAEKAVASAVYDQSWFGRLCEFIAGGPLPKLQLPWPAFLKKSDQARVQNVAASYQHAVDTEEEFEVSYKLDGGSMTVWLQDNSTITQELAGVRDHVVCVGSRNNQLITEDVIWNTVEQYRRWFATLLMMNRRLFRIWRFILPRVKKGLMASEDQYVSMCAELQLEKRLTKHYDATGQNVALQGELCGPGIQSNFEGLVKRMFFVYSVFLKEGNLYRELLPAEARAIVAALDLEYVPIKHLAAKLPATVKECLSLADGDAAFKKGGYREGLIYKSNTRKFSFKAISNSYLLKVSD
jgi:hypothetical protein